VIVLQVGKQGGGKSGHRVIGPSGDVKNRQNDSDLKLHQQLFAFLLRSPDDPMTTWPDQFTASGIP
jgi:hypothetical protein